ncbi:MAG: 3-methyl-2-oxobutanoate hydroxymethyltransferase, partial [Comamonas sp.]
MKSTTEFQQFKREERKIVMVTAYDYPGARYAEAAGADTILVGDSLGMVVLGYD